MAHGLVVVFAVAAVGAAAQPTIQIGTGQVVASGMTPGGEVAWLAYGRERPDWFSQVYDWQPTSLFADGSGQSTLDLGRPVPVKSVFVAVDVATGAYAASSPPEYPWATHVAFPGPGLGLGPDKVSVVSLHDAHADLEVLVVRPNVGAWRLTAHQDDPGPVAEPGVLVRFSDLVPWGGSPSSPGPLRAGDVVVGLDPGTMEYFAQQLPAHP